MKKILLISLLLLSLSCDKAPKKYHVWIESWYPKEPDNARGGRSYNDCIKLNDHQFLFVGKDGMGNTFDSSIITIGISK